ncbi:MAG: Asd/ArgC dimerization domain-containing protein, partial [Deltaproteobacteria bacterium]
VLKERNFPVARLVTAEDDDVEPDVPVLDLREGFEPLIADEHLSEKDFDLVFVAAPPHAVSDKSKAGGEAPFLRSPAQLAKTTLCTVIELGDGLAGESPIGVRIPFLEERGAPLGSAPSNRHLVSAHPAAIILSGLLLRLSSRFPLASAVAQVFVPASDLGPQAVDELQRQTTSLLSFQKLPEAVFGRQLAFNLLPRFGSGRQKVGALGQAEARIHHQVAAYLAENAGSKLAIPVPALRLVQAPVFHAVAVSLYVETAKPASVEELESALAQERMTITRLRDPAPSQADASGSNDILIDAVHRDASRKNGAWIWAVADNLRLAAVNAVEIAESESGLFRPSNQ